MSKKDFVLTVDVGACSLKAAEFFQKSNKLELIDFSCVEYSSEITDDNRHSEIYKTFTEILQTHKFKARRLYLSISGQEVFTRFAKIPTASTVKDQKLQQLVNYEARQNIPYPIEEVTWDYQLINIADSSSEEMSIMYAVIKNDIILSIVSVFERCGFETVLVGTSPTATYNCMCAMKIDEMEPSALINIGGRCTNIIFVGKGKFFARSIPLGGYSITQQISKDLNIPFNEAENLKRTTGYVSLGSNYQEGDQQSIAISTSIRNIMIRIHGEINRSINIYKSQHPDNNFAKVYLAGGSSVIKYTDSFLEEKLKLPIEYLNPANLVSIHDSVNKEELASVVHIFPELVGLAVNSVTSCPIEISLVPEFIRNKHNLRRKTPYFYAISVTFIMCLAIFYWGMRTQRELIDDLIITTTDQTRKIQESVTNVTVLTKELDTQKKIYNSVFQALEERNSWYEILDSIQKALPDNTWLVLIEPSGKPNITTDKEPLPETGIKSIFGKPKTRYPQAVVTSDSTSTAIEWIRVKAHTLVLFKSLKTTEPEKFKENLLKMATFSANAEDIVIVDYKTPLKESDNISSFDMIIKLRKPIKEP
ncbi:MAG TPA: hypothetical protein DD381_08910 [Lentisphaeria bacterium]|nr:MAG: hypothetical protein A2X47_07940 [Lentisphaerae bacterium GWF2_38_69]HBM16442.1 hypothetical protein [Lentisphaeria bacterium]